MLLVGVQMDLLDLVSQMQTYLLSTVFPVLFWHGFVSGSVQVWLGLGHMSAQRPPIGSTHRPRVWLSQDGPAGSTHAPATGMAESGGCLHPRPSLGATWKRHDTHRHCGIDDSRRLKGEMASTPSPSHSLVIVFTLGSHWVLIWFRFGSAWG